MPALQRGVVIGAEARSKVSVRRKGAFRQRDVAWMADAMSSVAARSFGTSASVIRPTSPYLNVPALAHSTTSAMACFLVVATRRAAVRNSLRSWLNAEPAADPLPLLCAGGEAAPSADGMVDPFPPFGVALFVGNEGFAISFDGVGPSAGGFTDPFPPFGVELVSGGKGFVVGCGGVTAGIVSGGDPVAVPSAATEPFADAG